MLHKLLIPFLALAHLFAPPATVEDHTRASIVRITGMTEGMMGPAGYVCTGFVVAPHTVLTANHCIGDNMEADGVPVNILRRDEGPNDLAVLDAPTAKKPLVFRDTDVLPGEEVIGVGYGWGWSHAMALHVHALFVHYAPEPMFAPGLFTQGGYIGGMSGGPVVDMSGLVVAVVQQSNSGIGYGVETTTIKAFLLGLY